MGYAPSLGPLLAMVVLMSDTTTNGVSVPDDYVSQVRDALSHLYDYAHLERHPLARLVGSATEAGDVAAALRDVLLDVLQRIHPEIHVSGDERFWRPYEILFLRYVDGFEPDAIAEKLHISRRQFQRDHRKGLLAAASVLWRLWQRCETGQGEAQLSSDENTDHQAGGPQIVRDEVAFMGLSLAWVLLDDLVNDAMGHARTLLRAHGMTLHVQLAGAPVSVRVDSVLARQALLGAVSALVALSPEHVAVACGGDATCATVTISAWPLPDANKGDALDELSAKLRAAGELIDAQGGQLTVVADGDRVVVRLTFPRAQGGRVLVVDDNERFLRLFERYLVGEGYEFQGVSGASAALEAVARQAPDVIIVDVMMRDVDGWDLLQQLRMRPELDQVPLIVCSVLNEPDLARALGAQAYLKKPVTQQQVLTAIRQLLSERSLVEPHQAER